MEPEDGRGFAEGHRVALDDQPFLRGLGVLDIPRTGGLADAGFADEGHDLTVPIAGAPKALPQQLELRPRPMKRC